MAKNNKKNPADAFRVELVKLLPGYRWTVPSTSPNPVRLYAVGVQSSGYNRLSTITVKRDLDGRWYDVSGYGYGRRSKMMGASCGATLARAIRALQHYYENESSKLAALARAIEEARVAVEGDK